MSYEEFWEQFKDDHEEWRYADSNALRKAAYEAGAASRDAEVTQLREQLDDMAGRNLVNQNAVRLQKEKVAELREQVALLRHASSDLLARTGINGKYAVELIEALATTEPKK